MHENVLRKDQIEFLINRIKNENLKSNLLQEYSYGRIFKGDYPTNKYKIHLSDKEKENIFDELTFLISSIGLDHNSDINPLGLIIEDIIDSLFK